MISIHQNLVTKIISNAHPLRLTHTIYLYVSLGALLSTRYVVMLQCVFPDTSREGPR